MGRRPAGAIDWSFLDRAEVKQNEPIPGARGARGENPIARKLKKLKPGECLIIRAAQCRGISLASVYKSVLHQAKLLKIQIVTRRDESALRIWRQRLRYGTRTQGQETEREPRAVVTTAAPGSLAAKLEKWEANGRKGRKPTRDDTQPKAQAKQLDLTPLEKVGYLKRQPDGSVKQVFYASAEAEQDEQL